jgi:hypothetical protein
MQVTEIRVKRDALGEAAAATRAASPGDGEVLLASIVSR